MLFSSDHQIKKLRIDGVVEVIANALNTQGSSGDGEAATAARLNTPVDLAVGPDGSIYVIESGSKVRVIDPSGIIHAAVQSEAGAQLVDGAPALDTQTRFPKQIAMGPDGCLTFGEFSCSGNDCQTVVGPRVRKTCPPSNRYGSEYIVPRPDGAEAYRFDLTGRHLRTVTGLRGQDRAALTYSNGLLSGISEGATTLLTVDRSSPGLVRLIARGGQTTQIVIGGGGYATGIAMGTGDSYGVTHELGTGFLTDIEEPSPRESFQHHFSYDADGLLARDRDSLPFTAGMTLARTYDRWGHTVLRDTAEGRTWRHTFSTSPALLSDNARASSIRIHEDPVGRTTSTEMRLDGESETIEGAQLSQASDKIVTTTKRAADPRWRLSAPYASRSDVTTAGATRTWSATRTAALSSSDPFSLTGATSVVEQAWDDGTGTAKWTRRFDATAGKWILKPPVHDGVEVHLWPDDRLKKVKLLGNAGTAPIADVDFTWDAGRLKTVSQAGHQVTYNYAGQDVFPTSVVGPMGRTLQFVSRDGSGRPTRMKLPSTPGAERYVDLAYDESGNLSVVRPPRGDGSTDYDHAISSNAVNALDTYAPPQLATPISPKDTLYGYDRDRLLRTDATPSGTISYTYDQAARVGTRQHPHATTTYSYAPDTGRLAEIADSGGISLSYAWSGPLLTKVGYAGTSGSAASTCSPAKHCIEYGYFDANDPPAKRGKKKWRKVDGAQIDFDYDDEGARKSASNGTFAYTLNRGGQGDHGLLKSSTVANVTETFDYDAWGALKSLQVTQNAAECFKIDSVLRDDAGRITRKVDTVLGASTNWDYAYHDQEGWLRSSNDFGPQGYDKNGNRAGPTFDRQDRIATGNGWSSWYWTNDGALWAIGNGSPLYYWTFDLLGNQRAATGPGRNRAYTIDGRDRRVIVRDNGSVMRQYLYDEDDRLVAQLNAWGDLQFQFVYASLAHVPDLIVTNTGVFRVVHDQVGSVRLILDAGWGAGCAPVQRIDYSTWGVPTHSGAWYTGLQPFGFAGGIYDEVTTQTRFGAREYDAWGGRWFTKDRSRFDGGINLYAYCENDPVNCIDPTGYGPTGLPSPGHRIADFMACVFRGNASSVCLSAAILGGAVPGTGPFRTPGEMPPPDAIDECRGRTTIMDMNSCCRRVCNYHGDPIDNAQCHSAVDPAQDCYNRCMDQLFE